MPPSRHLMLAIVGMLATSFSGCVSDEPVGAAAEEPLFGRVSYRASGGGTVTPFSAVHIERSMFHARTVARSPAFRTCVENHMNANYVPQGSGSVLAGDPAGGTAEALHRLEDFANPVEFLDYAYGGDSAGASASVNQSEYGHNFINTYMFDEEQLDGEIGWGGQPWGIRAEVMVHEYMHSRGYWHPGDLALMRNISAPYIIGRCASAVINRSSDACTGGIHACTAGSLNLVTSWTGTLDTTQTTTSCACRRDPLHVVALNSSSTNAMVTAYNGGGSTLRTDWGTSIGAWQWFYLYDTTGGNLVNNDQIYLRSWAGHFVRRTSTGWFADAWSNPMMRILRVGGPGTIADGTAVRLTDSLGVNYAYNDGAGLGTTTTATGSSRSFIIREPRRDHLVYLRTYHALHSSGVCDADHDDNPLESDNNCRYVHRGDDNFAYVTRLDTELDDPPHGAADEDKAEAAFWVLDWDGGELEDGDVVSFESFEGGSYGYLSVAAGDHTGHASFANAVGTYERFTLNILDGTTGAVTYSNDSMSGDHNRVSLRSANGTYLSAVPPAPAGDGTLRNYGATESIWTWFDIVPVSQYDEARAGW